MKNQQKTLHPFSTSLFLALAMCLPGTSLAEPQRTPARNYVFDRAAFETTLSAKLDNKVMGYSFVLMKNNQVISEGAKGNARNAADGVLAMKPSTPVNIGSLFKFVSGVSMLHALERAPAGSAGGSNSFETRLDAEFIYLIPNFWSAQIKFPQIRTISIRKLLQHKSGFRSDDMIKEFNSDFDPSLIGKRDYQNLNFSLLGFALGSYVKPGTLSLINNWDKAAPFDERYQVSQKVLGQEMDRYIRSNVLSKVPGGAVASCDAANEFKDSGAYAYKSRNDGSSGIITSRQESSKACIGAGGYWMSARHLAGLASTALHTDRLISAKTKGLMFSNNIDMDDRLVWSSASANNWTKANFGENYLVGSNGRQPYAGGQVSGGVLLRLPQSHVLVILINSPELDSSDMSNAGYQAFVAGMDKNFD